MAQQHQDDIAKQIYALCSSGRPYEEIRSSMHVLLSSFGGPPVSAPAAIYTRAEGTLDRVALLGLGAMGSAIGERLAARWNVKLWNRSECPQRNVTSISEACVGTKVLFTMLSNDAAVRDVVLAKGGMLDHMEEKAIHVSLSTISPTLAEELNQAHQRTATIFVSCPVFGRPPAAAKGLLYLLPGCEEESVMEAIRPYLEAIGQKIFPFNTPLQSSLAKVCGNFMIASTIETLGEVFAVAEKGGGIAPEKVVRGV